MIVSATARNNIAYRKFTASSALMAKVITMARMSIIGARTSMRRIIMYAFCTLVASVIRRVTSPAVE